MTATRFENKPQSYPQTQMPPITDMSRTKLATGNAE